MAPPRVLNVRTASKAELAAAIYVGRPSQWGNPFKLRYASDRAAVLRAYQAWIMRDLVYQRLLREAARHELRGKDLLCWCAPLPCHADVLLEIANG